MLNALKMILPVTVLLISAGLIGYKLGIMHEAMDRKPLEILNHCAYYDMGTGDFTWGTPPLTMTVDAGVTNGKPSHDHH